MLLWGTSIAFTVNIFFIWKYHGKKERDHNGLVTEAEIHKMWNTWKKYINTTTIWIAVLAVILLTICDSRTGIQEMFGQEVDIILLYWAVISAGISLTSWPQNLWLWRVWPFANHYPPNKATHMGEERDAPAPDEKHHGKDEHEHKHHKLKPSDIPSNEKAFHFYLKAAGIIATVVYFGYHFQLYSLGAWIYAHK